MAELPVIAEGQRRSLKEDDGQEERKQSDERVRRLHRSQNKVSVCASKSSGRRQSRAASNKPKLSDTMISTECQEQQQLTGSVCVCVCVCTAGYVCSTITPVHLGVFICARVCVCLVKKQRNPNTHWRISINITGCQSTSNNAAVIYDNVNTSSCEQPGKNDHKASAE